MTEGKIEHELRLMREELSRNKMTKIKVGRWIPESFVKRFFSYGETSMATLVKEGKVVTTKINNRRFYCEKSIIDLLEMNIITYK